MDELRVQRRLVKSPPELWAELSDAEALSRHLDLFGDIRISRLEPESTVAWEGERASGTVVLDSAGWGTKVTLTAEVRVPDPPAPPPRQETGDTTPVAATEQAGEPAVTTPAVTSERAEPAATPGPPAARGRRRPGLLARLFRRHGAGTQAHGEPEAGPATEVARPPITPEPALVAAPVEPPPVEPPPVAASAEPTPDPALAPEVAVTALEHVLDTLGAAHHRPFSR